MPVVNFIGSFIFAIIVIVGLAVTIALILFLCLFKRTRCASSSHRASDTPAQGFGDHDRTTTHRSTSAQAGASNAHDFWKSSWDEPIYADIIDVRDVAPRS